MIETGIKIRLALPERVLEFPRNPLLMGILNINDDSFSGDGSLELESTMERARRIIQQGGDIVDVGAESARTNREPVTEDEEIRRLRPFLEQWPRLVQEVAPRDEEQTFPPVLSVNTWRPAVVRASLDMGAEIINDMGGLGSPENAICCAKHNAALLIMHTVGLPKQAHDHIRYDDVVRRVEEFFADRMALAAENGLPTDNTLLDPGLGFAKQPEDDLRLCAAVERLAAFQRPLLFPISRKGFLGAVVDEPEAARRDAATVGAVMTLGWQPALILRVHHVEACWQALRLVCELKA
jgi:dihydropteroate synthase